MKIRQGFVTNSSSASFVVSKKGLTDEQLDAIRNHIEYSKKEGLERAYDLYCRDSDNWHVIEDTNHFILSTFMNNFRMDKFLEAIGAEDNIVRRM